MQDGNDKRQGAYTPDAPKAGIPPVVGYREGDGRVVTVTGTHGNAPRETVPAVESQEVSPHNAQPSERLKKVSRKQAFAVAGPIIFFYGIYSFVICLAGLLNGGLFSF